MTAPAAFTIYGAGLMGSLLAWRLARQGVKVTLLERAAEHSPQSAAWTAAAMVAPWAERSASTFDVFRNGELSLQLWPQLISELESETGMSCGYQCNGSLVVAHPADRNEMQQFCDQLSFNGLTPGMSEQVQMLDAASLRELEPNINAEFRQAVWLPQEAHLQQRILLTALWRAARQAGAELLFETAAEQQPAQGFILDCRGTGAAEDIQQLRGVRGEVLWLESEQRISRPLRLLHPRYHLYLVPKGESGGRYQYMLGATEIESDDRSPVSVRSAMELLSALYCLVPAFSEARIIAFDSNCRPALPDHNAAIIPFNNGQGLRVNGLFRHGYLQAPALLLTIQQHFGLPLSMNETYQQEVACA
ncbi:FAD-dependent oxidoreductase [Thalassolituus marinus]|uniref:FAD-dependent oxidoreductase n=1 Tax=Thalassolituus marinus TaxID=671053 RepID=A0ABS7ZRK5_9GAMM|nr:FAD-dependent oxidoreductase [Thalassolituus marinus]MCA6063150.1 FAD-dependent oxidoreductase [Thalassolituus marinus]